MARQELEVPAIMRIGLCLLEMDTVVEVEEEVIDHLLLLLLLGQRMSLSLLEVMVEGEGVQDQPAYPVDQLLGKEDELRLLQDWVGFEFELPWIG